MAISETATSQVELQPTFNPRSQVMDENDISSDVPDEPQNALPPADRGKDAYLVLAAVFILEALVWGFPSSFGVFQEYYSTHEPFRGNLASIAAIGTSSTGVMYLGAPLVCGVIRKFPRWRKVASMVGSSILLLSLVAASFANSIPQLIATQGVLYGIGGSIHYFPGFLYLDEWFVSRRGLAYGIVWAGNGVAGVVIPLLMRWLIESYGFRTALRTWTVVNFVLTIPAICFLKGRLPVQHASTGPQKLELGFLKSSAFWFLQAGNVFQALGYFMPTLYLPSFAQAVGLGSFAGTVSVSLVNAATVAGTTLFGFLTDRCHVTTVVNMCAAGVAVACFLFWSFAVNLPVLFLFAILYGFFAGGFAATWAGVTGPVRRRYPAVETGMIISFMSAGKGVGSVISGPLSGALVRSDMWRGHLGYAFGSGFGYLIVFSGVAASLSTVGWIGKKCGMV